jgi:hypothetical protein
MDRVFERTMLYDFYGELLKENQKSIYEDALLNDLSLSEIASDRGVSRQAVHDTIKRCNAQLEEFEDKLHLVSKFEAVKGTVSAINALIKQYRETGDEVCLKRIEELSDGIVDEF